MNLWILFFLIIFGSKGHCWSNFLIQFIIWSTLIYTPFFQWSAALLVVWNSKKNLNFQIWSMHQKITIFDNFTWKIHSIFHGLYLSLFGKVKEGDLQFERPIWMKCSLEMTQLFDAHGPKCWILDAYVRKKTL